jgi:hypothetical protein
VKNAEVSDVEEENAAEAADVETVAEAAEGDAVAREAVTRTCGFPSPSSVVS